MGEGVRMMEADMRRPGGVSAGSSELSFEGDGKDITAPVGSAQRAALAYAEVGLAIFPCRPDKSPLTGRGFHDASADPDKIKEWWARWPNALIGLPTTPANGIAVVDLDVCKDTGETIGEDEARKRGWLPLLLTAPSARTPSGGRHFRSEEHTSELQSRGHLVCRL